MQEKNIRNTVFRERLHTLMKTKSLTQKGLEALTGISQGAISDYLKGKSEPKSSALYQLSRIFGVSMEYLWGESDTEKSASGTTSQELAKAHQEIIRLKTKLKSAHLTLSGAYTLALEALKIEEEEQP